MNHLALSFSRRWFSKGKKTNKETKTTNNTTFRAQIGQIELQSMITFFLQKKKR